MRLWFGKDGEAQDRTKPAAGLGDPTGYAPGKPLYADVVCYFGDVPHRLYQIRQWLPQLERLGETYRLVIVTRSQASFTRLSQETGLRVILVPRFHQLMELYDASDFRLVLYVNNSRTNFQSLAGRTALHVHLGHGESDKACMVSGQLKAYDRVFVAGEAAVRRLGRSVMSFDLDRLVRVGRPQLDVVRYPVLPPSDRCTVMYAPTWEGEADGNNYSSLDEFGPAIVQAILGLPKVRVVYRPHPQALNSKNPRVQESHAAIVGQLDAASAANPAAGHVVDATSDVLGLCLSVDLLVTDISSVAYDFLYIRTAWPIVLADRRGDLAALRSSSALAASVPVIDADSVSGLTALLARQLAVDEYRSERERVRDFYYDGLKPGESTNRFLAAIEETLRMRDELASV